MASELDPYSKAKYDTMVWSKFKRYKRLDPYSKAKYDTIHNLLKCD